MTAPEIPMMSRCLSLIAGLSVATACLAAGPPATDEHLFSPDAFLAHVKYLASDELEGRRPGTPGIKAAAHYIARQFELAGLEPLGDDGTWFQTFEVRRGKQLTESDALLRISELDQTWRVREDWLPLPFTAQVSAEGPLAFAGYGIHAPQEQYDDFADFDAEGKILLVFRYEPETADEDHRFNGQELTRHSLFTRKARIAADQGARALLIVNPLSGDAADDELYAWNDSLAMRTLDLPMAHISRRMADALLKKADLPDLTALQRRIDEKLKPASADLGLTARLEPGVSVLRVKTRNVVGLLPGTGDNDDTIVIGAHYDHIGRIPPQFDRDRREPVIHNGADDNASGTAAVIELARVLGQQRGLEPDVLFVAFSAEEMGLLGSSYFVAHPPRPLEQFRAMINFDMIGRLSQDKFSVFGIPSAAEWETIVADAAEARALRYRSPAGFSGNSDHAVFYKQGIPYLFLFTGVHKQYHRPTDDWQLIDAEGATRVLHFAHQIVRTVADPGTRLTYQEQRRGRLAPDEAMKPGIEHEREQQQDEALGRMRAPHADGELGETRRPRVRFGIIPDFTGDEKPGLVADTVLDGGPAKAAGMRDGDRILRVGTRKIIDIYAYMDALRGFKPGEEVEVAVERDGKELVLKVKLEVSKQRRGNE
jgi:hypothetical protein